MKVFMYCIACDTEHEVDVITERRKFRILDHDVMSDFTYYKCDKADPGSEYAEYCDGKMLNDNRDNVWSEYLNGNWLN